MNRFNKQFRLWTLFASISFVASMFLVMEYIKLADDNIVPANDSLSTTISKQANVEYEQEEYDAYDSNLIKDLGEALIDLFSSPF